MKSYKVRRKKASASKFLIGIGLLSGVLGVNHIRDQRARDILDCFHEACKIEYESDRDENGVQIDYWQTPNETRERGKGDCEDFAFYLQDLLLRKGIKSDIRFGFISPIMPMGHAWNEVRLNGRGVILDASNGLILERKRPTQYPIAVEPLKLDPWKSLHEDYCKRRVKEFVEPARPYWNQLVDKGRKWMQKRK